MKLLKLNFLLLSFAIFFSACGSDSEPQMTSGEEQMKATMAQAEENMRKAEAETARIMAEAKAKEQGLLDKVAAKEAEERKVAEAEAAETAKREAARKKQAARKGVYVEAMCGAIEYCLEDKNGVKCYKLKSKEKQFRECIVPVTVYHAKNGKKTSVASKIKNNQEKTLLCT